MPDNVETQDEQELDTETPEGQIQEFAPGELAPFDYSPEPFAELSKTAETSLESICRECSVRDKAARRFEVVQTWKARLFKRGYQHLLRDRKGGWIIPGATSGYSIKDEAKYASLYETNIYGTHCDILSAALVRDIPTCRFAPFNPNYSPDITAADKANDFKEIFARNNDLKKIHLQAADYMCTDGRVLFYTRYVLDGQRFGFEDPADENPLAPEDEVTGAKPSNNEQEGLEEAREANESPVPVGRKPRGREVLDVYGKLEHKVPINTKDMSAMHFVQLSEEVDLTVAKAMFPQVADKIKPGAAGPAEIQLDRIARINSALALEASYVTGDALNKDVTVQKVWLRPSAFMDCKCTPEIRAELFKAFPDGALVVFAGTVFAFARNECMDDHLHILQAIPGSGQNRAALCTRLISVQERLNDWLDLLNDFFIKTVPQKWFDSEVFDLEKMKDQPNIPGGSHSFQRQPGVPVNELIMIEPTPTAQAAMPEFINFFFNEYPQMLSGALPALFGAESNTDTVGGYAMQRDQALGRLASPWSALQSATAAYFRQAVMCAAACREGTISESIPGRGTVSLESADLKGNILCFPEADTNFPETWIQRSSRLQQLMMEAPSTALVQKLFSYPKNMKLIKDGIGLTSLIIPEAASVDKQLGEFEILLKTGPVPNPQLVQGQKTFEDSMAQAKQMGHEAEFAQIAPQAMQALQALPATISTVPIDYEVEDHETEATTCQEWMNSPEGRRFKNGTPEERDAFANVRCHFMEHYAAGKKMAQENKQPPVPKVSISANVKDLPPREAAETMQVAGIQADPQDFGNDLAAKAQEKILVAKAKQKPTPPASPAVGGEPTPIEQNTESKIPA